MTARALLLAAAVVCFVLAAFDVWHNDVVTWFILAWAFFAAAFIAPADYRVNRRRT